MHSLGISHFEMEPNDWPRGTRKPTSSVPLGSAAPPEPQTASISYHIGNCQKIVAAHPTSHTHPIPRHALSLSLLSTFAKSSYSSQDRP